MLLQKINKFLSSLILIFRTRLLTSKKLNFPELDGLHPKILNEIVNHLGTIYRIIKPCKCITENDHKDHAVQPSAMCRKAS